MRNPWELTRPTKSHFGQMHLCRPVAVSRVQEDPLGTEALLMLPSIEFCEGVCETGIDLIRSLVARVNVLE